VTLHWQEEERGQKRRKEDLEIACFSIRGIKGMYKGTAGRLIANGAFYLIREKYVKKKGRDGEACITFKVAVKIKSKK